VTTDSIQFREGLDSDRDAMLALRRRAFPESSADMLRPDFWKWKFRDGYAGPAPFFVAEADGKMVGHLALIPQRYVADQPFIGGLTVDAMTDPDYRGRHIYARLVSLSGQRLRDTFDVFTAFQIRPHVLGGAVAAGWLPADTAPVLLRPLSIRGVLRAAGLPLRQSRGDKDLFSDSIRAIELPELGQIQGLANTGNIHQPRTVDFLRWRYLENPVWRYELSGFFEAGTLRAFVVHRLTPLRNIPTLAIVDAGYADEDSFKSLLRHVLRRGRASGAALAAALVTPPHAAHRALRRRGFFPGPHRFRFLLHVSDPSTQHTRNRPWALSWGDSDHL
jgi:hypothetical protein